MTLQEVLDMDPKQFNDACEAASVDFSGFKSINTDTETFAEAIEGFINFNSTPETIKAIHAAGRSLP
jgi:hypothetical protein